jgi:hypothetical protein
LSNYEIKIEEKIKIAFETAEREADDTKDWFKEIRDIEHLEDGEFP